MDVRERAIISLELTPDGSLQATLNLERGVIFRTLRNRSDLYSLLTADLSLLSSTPNLAKAIALVLSNGTSSTTGDT